MFKKVFNSIFQKAPFNSLLALSDALAGGQVDQLQVLTYHIIDNPQGFDQQVRHLMKNYHVASMDELRDARRGNKPLPPRSILVTFDDAYQNFGDCAWPILKRNHCPVTLFVPTAYPGNPDLAFWWDQLEYAFSHTQRLDPLPTPPGQLWLKTGEQRRQSFKRVRAYVKTLTHQETLAFVEEICAQLGVQPPPSKVLSWDALRALAAEGVTLGAHTRTHPLLSRIPLHQAQEEITGSLEDLRREIGPVAPIFAYPDGQYTAAVVETIKAAGIELAFTTVRGTVDLHSADPLRLRRNNVGRQADQMVLQARLFQAASHLDHFRPVPTG